MSWNPFVLGHDDDDDELEELNQRLDIFFDKAKDAPRHPPCRHDWVNVGFYSQTIVCKKCDKEKEDGN